MSGTIPSGPWKPGDTLTAASLDAAYNQFMALYNSLATSVGLIQSEGTNGGPLEFNLNWAGGSIVTPGDYILQLSAPYNFTITSISYAVGNNGGNFSFTLNNNGIAIGNVSNILVNNDIVTTIQPTSNGAIRQGDKFDLTITNVNGSPTNSIICIVATRSSFVPTGITQAQAVTQSGNILVTDSGVTLVFNILS